jgi:hypothetical protein
MLRDRGAADRQFAGKLTDRTGVIREPFEDRAPRRVAKRSQSF